MDKRKRVIILLGTLLFVFIIILILVLAFRNSDYRTKDLEETLDINLEEITKITISSPINKGQSKTTVEQTDINILIDYFDQFKYQRLSGDQTTYMPMKASIIYLYKGEQTGFIVPYGKEAMISYKVYQVKNGNVEKQFLIDFYNSIEVD